MRPRIRPFDDRDAGAVVDLSLRAWTPVFASLERVLGSEIFGRLHPDWREDQRRAARTRRPATSSCPWRGTSRTCSRPRNLADLVIDRTRPS